MPVYCMMYAQCTIFACPLVVIDEIIKQMTNQCRYRICENVSGAFINSFTAFRMHLRTRLFNNHKTLYIGTIKLAMETTRKKVTN